MAIRAAGMGLQALGYVTLGAFGTYGVATLFKALFTSATPEPMPELLPQPRHTPAPFPGPPSFYFTFFRGQARRAARMLGIVSPSLVESSTAGNAEVRADDHIHVNPVWIMQALGAHGDSSSRQSAVVLGVAAHEIGHLVARHADDDHPHERELEADRIAGWVLGRARTSAEDFAHVLHDLCRRTTPLHPPTSARRRAIRQGYRQALAGEPAPLLGVG
jgi:hypothetical protein